jgi:3-hydroxyisobutyrate dehydrogenase-like beta-hydroxyacid dehydrogenase
MENVGFLHPGQMGASMAASAQNSGCTVYWVSAGRSRQTRERAEAHKLVDAGTLAELCRTCSVIVSICPPEAAEAVAAEVAACAFAGIYLDANAIAPQKALRIGHLVEASGATFVDGSVIGGPAWQEGSTWLYLSGSAAPRVAACFAAGPLATHIIGETAGKASALKMCYAAYSKGTAALLYAILATAVELDVWAELEQQWKRDGSGLLERARNSSPNIAAKAWRFTGEMAEIADTFAAGQQAGFHLAAADVFGSLAGFREAPAEVVLEELLALLRRRCTQLP